MQRRTTFGPYEANGDRLRQAREAKGISQERFAERVGLTRRHYIRLENGENRPLGKTRDRICAELEISPATIQSSDDDEEAIEAMYSALLDRLEAVLLRRALSGGGSGFSPALAAPPPERAEAA